MDSKGRFLYLCDPLHREKNDISVQLKNKYPCAAALVFDENERWLPKTQRLFAEKGFPAIAAEGNACAIALAVAAQLPVERLMLKSCGIFDRRKLKAMPALMRRIAAFARRNLSLVAAEIEIADTAETEIRRLAEALSPLANMEMCTDGGLFRDFYGETLSPCVKRTEYV